MNNPYHTEGLETIFWVKIFKFFDADLGAGMEKIWVLDPEWKNFGYGMEKIRILDKHPGSAKLL